MATGDVPVADARIVDLRRCVVGSSLPAAGDGAVEPAVFDVHDCFIGPDQCGVSDFRSDRRGGSPTMTMPIAPVVIPDRKSNRALLLWGATLIVAGMGIGAGAAMLLHPRPPRPLAGQMPPLLDPRFRVEPLIRQMTHDLDLNSDQVT